MNHGARPTLTDHRDFDLHRSFGSVVPASFPDSYNTDAGLDIPDKIKDGLPYGCTDETQSEIANDIAQKALHNPFSLEAITHANAQGGIDVRTSLKAALSLGWINAFFNVRPYQLDFFDSIRLAMLSGAPEKRSLSIGTPWYPKWESTFNGTISAPDSYDPTGLPWHNWKVCGWKTINGSPYLIGKSWQGSNYGVGGYHYISREIINSVMTVSGTCAFTASDSKPDNIQTISVSTIQLIASWFRNLLGYRY